MSRVTRAVAAAGGVLALALGVTAAPAHAAVPARAAAPAPVKQLYASCAVTSDGRACVALQLVDAGSAQQHYQAAFSLAANTGKYLKPVSWTAHNPSFAVQTYAFTSGATGSSWSASVGSMSVPSVIEFAYNTPGATHRIYAGKSSNRNYSSSFGGASLVVSSKYYVENGALANRRDFAVSVPSTPSTNKVTYLRVFDAGNRTLFADGLPTDIAKQHHVAGPVTKAVLPTGVAVTVVVGNQKHTFVQKDVA